eukprot:TRINITY_DN10117_c0_g1_i6.p2 TRINITY_DN10117_c0_g1~~TRINITY_DN10117_c0_g1_i6.p2  ORF type:complete len:221 (+),score=58.70 TRINITY_DN10117_c0_g1_i6:405-1067(+)
MAEPRRRGRRHSGRDREKKPSKTQSRSPSRKRRSPTEENDHKHVSPLSPPRERSASPRDAPATKTQSPACAQLETPAAAASGGNSESGISPSRDAALPPPRKRDEPQSQPQPLQPQQRPQLLEGGGTLLQRVASEEHEIDTKLEELRRQKEVLTKRLLEATESDIERLKQRRCELAEQLRAGPPAPTAAEEAAEQERRLREIALRRTALRRRGLPQAVVQ